jgi:hypothetical protein
MRFCMFEFEFTFQRTEGKPRRPDGDGWEMVEQTAGTKFVNPLGINVGGLWLLWSRRVSADPEPRPLRKLDEEA